jgi:hypothetical protein
MSDTAQQIRLMQKWEAYQADQLKLLIEHVVVNAVEQARQGNTHPFDMLCRIAGMQMADGVTNYQRELREALKEYA